MVALRDIEHRHQAGDAGPDTTQDGEESCQMPREKIPANRLPFPLLCGGRAATLLGHSDSRSPEDRSS